MKIFREIRHWLAHRFDWNEGSSEVWIDPDGKLMAAFLCWGCGNLYHVHEVSLPVHRVKNG